MSSECPVAIVGIGCKFPGSNTKDQYYEFLRSKGDGMTEPPKDRWNHDEWNGRKDEPGKYCSSMGGFISGIDEFDPFEFGISVKEAAHLDLSLRHTLEVAHMALHDSSIDYRGSNTGVYFAQLLVSTDELHMDRYEINSHAGVGKNVAIRANRVSFTFDLRGPSMTIDTACSSSGTAMHLALQAIRLGEIDQALVIGASTMINPEHTVSFSKLGVLSPTGSSKSFDAAADGYARAEGFGAVLIKRLEQAVHDEDTVYSVIKGSAINANGKGKSLTMPEADRQGDTIKTAYRWANRDPAEAFFVELHATGTLVGDPIEVNGAGRIFSQGRDVRKTLRVGSVKGNIGHSEGCSFLASLIKVSMMLHNKEVIPNYRFNKPNPKIDFVRGKMRVQTELEKMTPEMAGKDGKWVTSVSSYGVGGANAHVVVETFETVDQVSNAITASEEVAHPLYLFTVGTLTEASIVRWQEVLSEAFDGITIPRTLRSLARELARQARAYPYRAFAVASSLSKEVKFSKPERIPSEANPKLCLVFAGQGPQHVFMGRQLAEGFPAFLAAIKANDEVLVTKYNQPSFLAHSGLFVPGVQAKLAANGVWPVRDVVISLVFFQTALVDLIKSLGIHYDVVVGHSIGEIAMGYASGHYDRATAIGIAVARAAAMTKAEGNGSMVALGVGVQRAKIMIKKVLEKAGVSDGLWVAGINSPKAVTVAGRTELIDAMVELAADPANKVFAAKLRVTCAFHTPLMEPQEETFKELMKTAVTEMHEPTARVMSTVEGKWLGRELDIDYCWDNIRKPVLFGTAINKIVSDIGDVLFLEVAPHPVLKSYVEEIGGIPVSLVKRPNPKVPAQNTGEHYQFLEGFGGLLSAGFKRVDYSKFFAGVDGNTDFEKVKLPPYPYNKQSLWSESLEIKSLRLKKKTRPVAAPHFRLNVDSHPSLTGHIVMDAVLYPGSGYIEAILENGAMILKDFAVHKPLVLVAHDSDPAHAGCVISGNNFEFRASTSNTFTDGAITLDTLYASGIFFKENPAFDESKPRMFDLKETLSRSTMTITGDEFYDAIPSGYGYKDHFRNYLKLVHEVIDDDSWGARAYLTRLDIPQDTPDVFDDGWVIHPGILDSITQCGLAMAINFVTKTFDFNGTFLPVKVEAFTRWDSKDAPSLNRELRAGSIWTYYKLRTWGPKGPFISDYVVCNSEGRVLFTIDGFEIALAPEPEPVVIDDSSKGERLATTWQPTAFSVPNYLLPTVTSGVAHQYLSTAIGELLTQARNDGGRHSVRVIDLDVAADIAKALDSVLSHSLESGLITEYFCAGTTPELADAKTSGMTYAHKRSCIADVDKLEDELEVPSMSFDIVLRPVALSQVPINLAYLTKFLGESGALVLLVTEQATSEDTISHESLSMQALTDRLRALSADDVQVKELPNGQAIILARHFSPITQLTEEDKQVVIYHMEHGNEGALVDLVNTISSSSELWVVGNDDAAGIAALGVAACLAAESPDYVVRSILFEDHSLVQDEREDLIHVLREKPFHLEQHMKIRSSGAVYVRRLVHGGKKIKDITTPAVVVAPSSSGTVSLSAAFPPTVIANDVEVRVECIGLQDLSESVPATFVGTVEVLGADVKGLEKGDKVVVYAVSPLTTKLVVDSRSVAKLPSGLIPQDAAALPAITIAPWVGLHDLSADSVVLVHDALSRAGFGAVQLCQRAGAQLFCTVSSKAEAERLSFEYNVKASAIAFSYAIDEALAIAKKWLRSNRLRGFDIVFNSDGNESLAVGADVITPVGRYVVNKRPSSTAVLPPGAPGTQIVDISSLAHSYSSKLASYLTVIMDAHLAQPFSLPSNLVSITDTTVLALATRNLDVPVLNVAEPPVVRVNFLAQLFDPRKSYILVGGSSELGVRIATWMVDHGARHIFLTSRRGEKALTKVDGLYINYLRMKGARIAVVAANAVSKRDMSVLVDQAKQVGSIGGVFLMTVVLRDAAFSNLTQESFDDVYESKVDCLNVLISLVKPADLDFLLLFSTIGSVFGNAGQAAYCASQLYLDRIADVLPNTISMSFPPITDSGIFKRLVMATKGRANTGQLTKTGMTTAQVCNFIGDCLVRTIAHYVPMLAVGDVPETFPACEPLLYAHLLPAKFLNAGGRGNKGDAGETPATLLAALLGMSPDQITENALITSFGLDSLAATRYSHQLKSNFKIQVSQIELLGSMTVGTLNELIRKIGLSSTGDAGPAAVDDGSAKYGYPLLPILNDRHAYDEPYTTDASPHQYRIWLAQTESDNARKRTASHIDPTMSRFGATQWDTHEGYFLSMHSETDIDWDRMRKAMAEVVQRHGALRTTFKWNDALGKLEQTIYPTVEFDSEVVDLSDDPDGEKKAYNMTLAQNNEPGFQLDQLPLLSAKMYKLVGSTYAFSVVIHHIIIDETSLGVFFYELFMIYLHGIDYLSPVDYHYSDFSDWFLRTANRRAELRDAQLQYWVDALSDIQPLHLTLAKPSDVQQSTITQIQGDIDSEALAQYQKLCSNASVTEFTGFFAVYNILLHKYSSQTKFAVGTAVTQRSLSQLQDVMGFFSNILPIRTAIDEEQTFVDYLATFKDVLMDSLAHDDVTYEDIVAQGKTSAQSRGYFKHLFARGFSVKMMEEFEKAKMHPRDILSLPNDVEKYEFLLVAHTKTGKLVLRFDNYLYSEETARQFLDAYIGLIGTLGLAPNMKIRDVSAVSRREEIHLIQELSSSGPVKPVERLLHGLVEEQAELTPTSTAIEFEDKSLTYAELNRKANQLAYLLMQEGIGPETIVAICFDRGIHQILAILAVLKAGGAFVPLDPDDPTLRKEMLIVDCQAKFALTTLSHRRAFDKSIASKVIVAYIDEPSFEQRLNRFDDTNLFTPSLTTSNLAYIMFTSGSTGKPKGVMIEHRSIANLVQHSRLYGYRRGARVLSSLAYTFDPFVVDVFGTLSCGATLVTGVKELVLGDIGKALKTLNVNVLHVTPSILAVVPLDSYPSLETVVVAGEALGKKLIEDWSKRVIFMNMYGPTEASVDCVSCHVTSTALAGVIGRPLPNSRLYILDEQMRPAPVGVEGELYIGGIQLARGYLHQPELTKASFIPNPFVTGERLYRTGDIALYRPDGNIEYRGRKDRQIKLRGQRIELGEVEDVIVKYHAVKRATVIIRSIHDDSAIVTFVEFRDNVTADRVEDEKEALRLHVSERLPRFMYPSLVAVLPQLPTSRSGKIDRGALAKLDLAPFAPDLSQELGQPQSEIESDLLAMFSNLLRVDSNTFGVTHDLFSVGLNSLMAVQAAGIISKTFKVYMGLNNMYLRPTIRELATLVIDAMGQDQRQIMEAEDADNEYLIEFLPIKKKGIQPRLFLVHDVTGMATPFMRLGVYMPNEMYAIGDRDFGSPTGFTSIESMADHYITLLKSVQPTGPYVISGYSLGGLAALSMASKLTNAGEKVAHLILFDTVFIPARERQSLKSSNWASRTIDRISENFPEIGEKWKNKLRTEIRKNLNAMWDFEVPHYDGATTLVVPKDRSWYRSGAASDFDSGADDRNGWDLRLSNLDMKVASGRHDTMFTPAHVKVLAGMLKEIFASIPSDELSPSQSISVNKVTATRAQNGSATNGHAR